MARQCQSKKKEKQVKLHLRWIFMTALLVSLAGCANFGESKRPLNTATLPYTLIPNAAQPFRPGEIHEYDVYWHILKIGGIAFHVEEVRSEPVKELVVSSQTQATGPVGNLAQFGGNGRTRIDPESFLPSIYTWDNGNPSSIKRRYSEFSQDEGIVRGLEIGPDWWTPRTRSVTLAQDPLSVLMLLRVLDLPVGNEVRLDLIDGHKHRLCRITSMKDRLTPAEKRRSGRKNDGWN